MTQEKIEQEFRNWLLDFSTTYITDPYMARQAYLAGRKSTVPKIKEALNIVYAINPMQRDVFKVLEILEEIVYE